MGRREAGLLVIMRRLHLRYAVTRGLVCATKPSSPPRVTLILYRPFRTILEGCLLHVRYRDGARVIRYPCLSMFDAFRTFGKQNRPFALASRPKSYRSRPPPYPRLWFGLRAYDTYRENATRSPSVSSSSVDEAQPASCCWCRCRPAGVTAETTAVDQPLLQAYRPARGRRAVRSCASVIPVSLCTGEAFRPRE